MPLINAHADVSREDGAFQQANHGAQFIGIMIPLDGQIYCVQTYVNNRKTIFISRLMILKRFKGFILFMFKGY